MKRVSGISIAVISMVVIILSFNELMAANLATNRFIYPEYSKTISMDFKNARIDDVLKIFSQQSNLNFIASQDILNKEITLFLEKVPVEEALERILQANDLTYEIQPGSDIFIVKSVEKPSKELLTRVYYFQYATVSTSKLNQTISFEESEDSSSSSTEDSSSESTDAGILAALQSVLTSSGNIVEDPRTNSVIITDIPSIFPIIEETIARLDVPIPQILIEVEMLDISKTTGDQLGIRMGGTPFSFTGAQKHHVYPWDQNNILESGRHVFDSEENPEFVVGTIDASGFSATVQFLKSQTDTKYLARPQILTLNNETAEIKISTNEAIGIATQTDATEGVATQSVEAERVETGVFLTVTPQANLLTNEITMAIAPRVVEARTGGTFSNTTFKDPEERGTKSILKIRDGNTIIIGGLLRTDISNTLTKLPILGDIPFIGMAFRHKDKTVQDRELVIFITPHILQEEAISKITGNGGNQNGDIPPERLKAIEKALTLIERKSL